MKYPEIYRVTKTGGLMDLCPLVQTDDFSVSLKSPRSILGPLCSWKHHLKTQWCFQLHLLREDCENLSFYFKLLGFCGLSTTDLYKDQQFIWGRNAYIVWQLVFNIFLITTHNLPGLQVLSKTDLLVKTYLFNESVYVLCDFFWHLYLHAQYLSLKTLNKVFFDISL